MSRILQTFFSGFVLIAALLGGSSESKAAEQNEILAEAVKFAEAREWEDAILQRDRLDDPVARDIVEWIRLRAGQGTFKECSDFLNRNADWPGMPFLHRNCERSLTVRLRANRVVEFFEQRPPQTATGAYRYAAALRDLKQSELAAQVATEAWRTMIMSLQTQTLFQDSFSEIARENLLARLDHLLWEGQTDQARNLYGNIPRGWRLLAEARIALRQKQNGVDEKIAAVPDNLKDHPGLAFERTLWRARSGRQAGAIELMANRSVSRASLGRPVKWASMRRSYARQLMRDGDPVSAYALASSHFLEGGSDFADLEWLSGFLALTELNGPQQALDHFLAFDAAVKTPISKGRAGYWIGMAYEALGNDPAAQEAFKKAAEWQSTFYGQLAAEKLGISANSEFADREEFPSWQSLSVLDSSVFRAAMHLQTAGHLDLTERFFVHLSERLSRSEIGTLTDLAKALGEPHLEIRIAKQAARMGWEIGPSLFPTPQLGANISSVSPIWVYSIIRRESEFDPSVVSPVGARGLMQLMPPTAREMSSKSGENYAAERLIKDPDFNIRLGSLYLVELAERYRNNPILMAIAYNAGPGRADDWLQRFGDPRRSAEDLVRWIEYIPFRETRNYVMRVTESFAPYRAILSETADTISIKSRLGL